MAHFPSLARELGALAGGHCAAQPERRVGGGSINECYAWRCESRLLFVKVAARAALSAFAAESEGLAALSAARTVRVPKVLACGATEHDAFLALEWIERGPGDARTEWRLGEGLAALHRVTAARFGFVHDNFIGATPQPMPGTRTGHASSPSAACGRSSSSPRATAFLRACRRLARGCWLPSRGCWPDTSRPPRSCTGISGVATGSRTRPDSRWSSIRPSTTATPRRISR